MKLSTQNKARDRRSRSFQGAKVPGWSKRDNYTCSLTNLKSSALKRLRTPTNQRLALLFNNAIGPEQEPMRARLSLLEFELYMVRRSPAIAGATPSFAERPSHSNWLVITQLL